MEEDMNHSGFIHLLKPKHRRVLNTFEFSIVLRAWSKKQLYFFKETQTNSSAATELKRGSEVNK